MFTLSIHTTLGKQCRFRLKTQGLHFKLDVWMWRLLKMLTQTPTLAP